MKINEKSNDDFNKVDRLLDNIFRNYGGFEEFSKTIKENEDLQPEFENLEYMAGTYNKSEKQDEKPSNKKSKQQPRKRSNK